MKGTGRCSSKWLRCFIMSSWNAIEFFLENLISCQNFGFKVENEIQCVDLAQGRKNETLHSCAVQSTNSSRRALLIGGVNVLCTTYIVLKLVYVNEGFFPLLFSLMCCEKRVWSVSQLSKPFWCCYCRLICKFNFTQFWMQLLDVGENDCMHSISLSGFDCRRVWRVNIRRNWMRCFPTSWRTRLKASPTTTSGVWCLEIICPRARRKSFTMKYSTLMTSER